MFRISYKMVVITNKMYEFYQHFRNFYPQTKRKDFFNSVNIWFNRSCHNIVNFIKNIALLKFYHAEQY